MHRYFSHYTFIYPDIYLKNHIVEMNDDGHIVRYFPFEKEIEKTEFHSGLLMFVPKDITLDEILYMKDIQLKLECVKNTSYCISDIIYDLCDEGEAKIN